MNWIAVAIGAGLGGCARYALNLWLPVADGRLPWSTLAANWIGAYAAGLLLAWFSSVPDLPPALRLFAITGLLGGLTTFSTFSLEVMQLLQRGQMLLASGHLTLHVGGSLVLCFAGYATIQR